MSQNKTTMSLARFSALLDSYGANLNRFPAAEREAATDLLARDAEAARMHMAARALDGLLDAVAEPTVAPSLRAKVAEIPLRHARAQTQPFAVFGLRRWLMAGAMACALGVVSGAWFADDATTMSDDSWDDVASVAFAADLEEGL